MDVVQLSVPNFPSDAKDALEREAKRQDRSLASLCRTVLLDFAGRLETGAAPVEPTPTAEAA